MFVGQTIFGVNLFVRLGYLGRIMVALVILIFF